MRDDVRMPESVASLCCMRHVRGWSDCVGGTTAGRARARAGIDLRILATGKNDIVNRKPERRKYFSLQIPRHVPPADPLASRDRVMQSPHAAMASRITLLTMGYVEI